MATVLATRIAAIEAFGYTVTVVQNGEFVEATATGDAGSTSVHLRGGAPSIETQAVIRLHAIIVDRHAGK